MLKEITDFLRDCLKKQVFAVLENILNLKKCLRCNKLIPNSIYKKIHNFVMHYGEGIYNIVETKPLDYEDIGEIEVYEISYDFYDLIR